LNYQDDLFLIIYITLARSVVHLLPKKLYNNYIIISIL